MLKIEAIQSGGMVPVPKTWSFDSASADPAQTAELSALLEASDFFQVSEPSPIAGADRALLSICVESDGQSRRLTIPLDNIPDGMVRLGAYITSHLEWRPRGS